MQTSLNPKTFIPDQRFQWSAPPLSSTSLDVAAASPHRPATAPVPVPSLPLDVSSRFGLRLRELRRERSLTQAKMASEFGIDRSFISDVERGRKSISLPMLEIISLGMKISLSELLQNI